MAKRNQYNKATLSTITTLSCSYVTSSAVSASQITGSFISASSQINGRLNCGTSNFFFVQSADTITIPVNANFVAVAANSTQVTASIDWTGFNYAQSYKIINVGTQTMKVSGAVSASGADQWGAAGFDGVYVNNTPLNEFLIPSEKWVEGIGYPSGSILANTVKATYVIYASGSTPRIPI